MHSIHKSQVIFIPKHKFSSLNGPQNNNLCVYIIIAIVLPDDSF